MWTQIYMELILAYLLMESVLPTISTYLVSRREVRRAQAICQGLLRTNRYAPGFLRLAFHDCIGGCNGCIDLTDPANKGLETYMEPLNEAWNLRRVKEYMSRSDFWILCANEAVLHAFNEAQLESEELRQEEAREKRRLELAKLRNSRRARQPPTSSELEEGYHDTKSPPPALPLKFGRMDCHPTVSNQSSGNTFPKPESGLRDTLRFFWDHFRFNARETVAILGVHTLGDAKARASGFEGTFTAHDQWLDNEYYVDMIDKAKDWRQTNARQRDRGTAPRWQWVRPDTNGNLEFLLFNSDICLVRDIEPDQDGRVTRTEPRLSKTYPIVKEFADNNALWIQEFSRVFTKMISMVPRGVTLRNARN